MADIIKLLPESLANQIAAGEVVQRPASVVKELLENSIDAHASEIILIVKDAGKSLIQVIDNGIGMSETDARMCFERHATSKIKTTADMFNIRTMGFRGEAMASIAAVAQVELKTKRQEDELGTLIKIEGSQIKETSHTACNKGASIAVKNLFFNVPARRNFLKANPVEFKHIAEEFIRIALSNYEIAFSLYHNEEEIFVLGASKLAARIFSLLGNGLKNQLASCKEETERVQLYGYIGQPAAAKKTRGDQFLFVNGRYIRHPYLHHAIVEAYKGMIDEDAYPLYVLFLTIEPKHIDINVHPTKTEIKFDDERTVYGVVSAAVRRALSTFNLNQNLDFSENINQTIFEGFGAKARSSNTKDYTSSNHFFSNTKSNNKDWERMYEGLKNNLADQNDKPENQSKLELRMQSGMHAETRIQPTFDENAVVFQIHQSYIVTQVRSGMMLIDQQAAHERILYDKFISMLEKRVGSSQQFLFPLTLELSQLDFTLVNELKDEIHALGFSFQFASNNAIVINGIPTDIRPGNEKAIFEGLIEQFKWNKDTLQIADRENLARSLSKKSAIKKGTKMSNKEMLSLIEQLFSSQNPSIAPSGNLTLITFEMDKLNELFI
jgi:DNA mismatch repair protein MutL